MLQQTTVGAVPGRYEAFLARFPDLPRLARAREIERAGGVVRAGLLRARPQSPPRRARDPAPPPRPAPRAIPRPARRFPVSASTSPPRSRRSPSAARVPAADANVTRVLSRLFAIGGDGRHEAARGSGARARAEALLGRAPAGRRDGGAHGPGPAVCTPRRPDCPACPIASHCESLERGSPERLPLRPARPATERVFVAAACAARGGRTLLLQRSGGLLRGLWQFPASEAGSAAAALRALKRDLRSVGLRLDARKRPVLTRHTIVHRRLAITVYRALSAPAPASSGARASSVKWFTPEQLSRAAIPTLTRKIAVASGFLPASAG